MEAGGEASLPSGERKPGAGKPSPELINIFSFFISIP